MNECCVLDGEKCANWHTDMKSDFDDTTQSVCFVISAGDEKQDKLLSEQHSC